MPLNEYVSRERTHYYIAACLITSLARQTAVGASLARASVMTLRSRTLVARGQYTTVIRLVWPVALALHHREREPVCFRSLRGFRALVESWLSNSVLVPKLSALVSTEKNGDFDDGRNRTANEFSPQTLTD